MTKITLLVLCAHVALTLQAEISYRKELSVNNFQKSGLSTRIINGIDAKKGQFPWQVVMDIKYTVGYGICGGSLISSTWVLTAAHCVQDPILVVAYLGVAQLQDPDLIIVTASKVLTHPNYVGAVFVNDIALVRLSKPVTFSDYVQPIKLAKTALAEGSKVTVSGWGKTSDSATVSSQLNYVSLVTISNNKCAELYGSFLLTGGYVCAKGEETENTCQGDSGGPLITGSGDSAELVGIVSFVYALSCSAGFPSGYTRVAPYTEWIAQIIGA